MMERTRAQVAFDASISAVNDAATEFSRHFAETNDDNPDAEKIAAELESDVLQTIELVNKRARKMDPSALPVGAKKRNRERVKAAIAETALELVNESGDVAFLVTKLVKIPLLFYMSIATLCLSLMGRLWSSLTLWNQVDKTQRGWYMFGIIVGMIEPNIGLRMVKGTLKDREEGGATRWDSTTNSKVHVDEDPVATQARIDYNTGRAEIRTLLINVLTQDASELLIEILYLGYAEQAELYDPLYLISAATTLLHMIMQLYEAWCIWETLAELRVVMETRDKTFNNDSTDEDVLQFLQVNGHKVRSITLNKCTNITDNALRHIAKACPLLRKLSMGECTGVTDEGFKALAEHCRSIATFWLIGCTGVTDEGIKAMAEHCRSIATLQLEGCTGVTDEGIKALAEHCRSIVILSLSGCTGVTDEGIKVLAEQCRSIVTLDLSYCTGVTDEGVKALAEHCRSIVALGLYCCTGVTDEGIKALAEHCRSITNLFLRGCTGVTDEGIKALAEQCRSIVTLDLSYCTGVTGEGVKALAEHCRFIVALDLSYCTGVTDKSFRSNLTREDLERFLKTCLGQRAQDTGCEQDGAQALIKAPIPKRMVV
jgi:bacterioferritin-associated ferredoxin